MRLRDVLDKIVRKPSESFATFRIPAPPEQEVGAPARFKRDATYVEIRLAQMHLRDQRVAWRDFIPVASVFTDFQFAEGRRVVPFVVEPKILAQAAQIDSVDPVRFVNRRVAGPFPYAGDDVMLFVALNRLESRNWLREIVSLLGNVAQTFDVSKLSSYVDVAGALTNGLQGLMGLEEVEQRIGVDRSFETVPDDPAEAVPEGALRPGYEVFINADSRDYPESSQGRFSVEKHTLCYDGKEFRDADFVVLEIKCSDVRHDHTTFDFHAVHWPKIEEHVVHGREDAAWSRLEFLGVDLLQCQDLVYDHRSALLLEYSDKLRGRIALRKQAFERGDRQAFESLARIKPPSDAELSAAVRRRSGDVTRSPEQLLAGLRG